MGSYIETSLMPGEQVIYNGRVSIWSVIHVLISGAFFIVVAIICMFAGAAGFGLLLLLAGGLCLLNAFLRYSTTECALTNRRIIAKFGFIRRTTIDLDLRKTESIRLDQGILGRLFNFGSIVVSGAGNPQAPVPGITEPTQFRKAFLTVQEQANQANQAKPVATVT